eukprot:9120-Eustigmatos_ZCMA.PRE.1
MSLKRRFVSKGLCELACAALKALPTRRGLHLSVMEIIYALTPPGGVTRLGEEGACELLCEALKRLPDDGKV